MKDPFSKWKGNRGAVKRIFSRSRLFKNEESRDEETESSKAVDEKQKGQTRRNQAESSSNPKSLKRNFRGLFDFGGGDRSSSTTEEARVVAEGEETWTFESPPAEDRDDFVPYSDIEELDVDRQNNLVLTNKRSDDQEGNRSSEPSSPNSIEYEEFGFTDTTSDDTEEDFILPEGFLGKFRENTEPLFSHLDYTYSGLSTIQEEDSEQSTSILDSSSLTSIKSSSSAEEDKSTKWVNLLHKNVVYERKSMERNVEVSVDRDNPIGAALKIRLQRERSAEKSIHDEPSVAIIRDPIDAKTESNSIPDKSLGNGLHDQIDAALGRLEGDGSKSNLDCSACTQSQNQRDSLPEKLNTGLTITMQQVETIIGETLSCRSPRVERDIYTSLTRTGTRTDAETASVASSVGMGMGLKEIEVLLGYTYTYTSAAEERETSRELISKASCPGEAKVETENNIQSLAVPSTTHTENAYDNVMNGMDHGNFQHTHSESIEVDVSSHRSNSHDT